MRAGALGTGQAPALLATRFPGGARAAESGPSPGETVRRGVAIDHAGDAATPAAGADPEAQVDVLVAGQIELEIRRAAAFSRDILATPCDKFSPARGGAEPPERRPGAPFCRGAAFRAEAFPEAIATRHGPSMADGIDG
jgi:hypothetical protein